MKSKELIETGDWARIKITEPQTEWGMPKSFIGKEFWGRIKGIWENQEGKTVYGIEFMDDLNLFWIVDIIEDTWDEHCTMFFNKARIYQLLEEATKIMEERATEEKPYDSQKVN